MMRARWWPLPAAKTGTKNPRRSRNGFARSFLAPKLCYQVNSNHAAPWSLKESLTVVGLNVAILFSAGPALAKAKCKLRARS